MDVVAAGIAEDSDRYVAVDSSSPRKIIILIDSLFTNDEGPSDAVCVFSLRLHCRLPRRQKIVDGSEKLPGGRADHHV